MMFSHFLYVMFMLKSLNVNASSPTLLVMVGPICAACGAIYVQGRPKPYGYTFLLGRCSGVLPVLPAPAPLPVVNNTGPLATCIQNKTTHTSPVHALADVLSF
jgi:hypothetical protein